jgi:predicted SprT family Zn-dependent metalloprotease
MWIVVSVLAVVVVIAACYFFFRSRSEVEEPVYHFNCTKCKRRMRYHKAQAGRHAVCPGCRQQFVIPPIPAK